MQQGGCHVPETVPGHFVLGEAHRPQRGVDGVLAHAARLAADRRKQEALGAGELVQLAKERDRLP